MKKKVFALFLAFLLSISSAVFANEETPRPLSIYDGKGVLGDSFDELQSTADKLSEKHHIRILFGYMRSSDAETCDSFGQKFCVENYPNEQGIMMVYNVDEDLWDISEINIDYLSEDDEYTIYDSFEQGGNDYIACAEGYFDGMDKFLTKNPITPDPSLQGTVETPIAVSENALLNDLADILTDEEEEKLENLLGHVSNENKFDIMVLTVESMNTSDAELFANTYYKEHSLGYNSGEDGILLVLSMEYRDWAIALGGFGDTAFNEYGRTYLAENFLKYFSDDEYYDGFEIYAKLAGDFVKEARDGKPYSEDHKKIEFVGVFGTVGAVLIGFGIVLAIAFYKKSKLKSVHTVDSAQNYFREGSMVLTQNSDVFINRITTSRRINTDSGSSGGGGSINSGGSSGKF